MTLYQPFLDRAIAILESRLDLQPYPIPAGFERKSAIVGKGKNEHEIVTTSYAFQSPKIRQIRAAHVQGGKSLQVLNFVIFPQLNCDLPFFGADLVTLPGGHLIALDMQPLFRDDRVYQAKYSDPILPIFHAYQKHLPWGGDFPEEARPFFSPAFLWTRPQENSAVETHVFAAFVDYLQAYRRFSNARGDRSSTIAVLALSFRKRPRAGNVSTFLWLGMDGRIHSRFSLRSGTKIIESKLKTHQI
jgi:phycoerythrobilin:ferredoxin oxidoreductase